MTLKIKIILWASIAWLVPLQYFVNRNEAKFKKNILIGATLPFEAREDPEVAEITKRYKRDLGLVSVILLLLIIPFNLPQKMNWLLALWCIWIDLVVVLQALPFIFANKKLRILKAERGWRKTPEETGKITVDITNITVPEWRSPWIFFISTAATIVPAAFRKESWILCVIFMLTQITFYLVYRYCFRTRSEAVDSNTELTASLTEIRRRIWGNFWALLAVGTAIYSVMSALFLYKERVVLWSTVVYTLWVVIMAYRNEIKIRTLQEKLTAGSGKNEYIDEDDYWIWGQLYYNENDSHTMVNMRTGMGTTVNLAKPFGKGLMLFAVICMVMMPFTGFLLDAGIKTDISYVYSDDSFTVVCGKNEYEVKHELIADIEFLDKLPEKMTRTWGTATEDFLQGNFSIEGKGSVRVLLNKSAAPYVMITAKNGGHWLFGTGDTEKGQEFLRYLRELEIRLKNE